VFLEPGGRLNIQAGTVIKFTDRADLGNPSALVITRGAQIYAEGTANAPIIFTAAADDVNDPADLGPTDNALWGGIVVLGSGITQKNGNAEVSVEGISTSEPRGLYGGNNNADNSGVLRYVHPPRWSSDCLWQRTQWSYTGCCGQRYNDGIYRSIRQL
jgi:hypothetical protein